MAEPSTSGALEQALSAYRRLYRAFRSVQQEANSGYASHDLTPSQFASLEALHAHGSLCQSDIAMRIRRSGGNLTMVIDNLERRGLVLRRPSDIDRRLKLVELTSAGETKIAAVMPEHAARIRELMARLSPREQIQLSRLCRKLDRRA